LALSRNGQLQFLVLCRIFAYRLSQAPLFSPPEKATMSVPAPSPDQWRRLYHLAARLKELAPWEWMEEIDLFGVQDPQGGTIHFAGFMGLIKEHFALALYLGPRALHGFLDLHRQSGPPDPEALLNIPQLQLSFEDREMIQREDRQVLKQLGLSFRGANNWPLWRSYRPGFLPWFIDAEEGRLLELAILQSLDVAPRFRRDPALLYPGGEDRYLVRVETGGAWQDQYLHVPPVPTPQVAGALDELSLARLRQLPRADRILQLDCSRFWSPVREGADRPCFPNMLLLVGASDGMVLGFELLPPLPSLEEMWAALPQRLAQQFTQLGWLPAGVQLINPRLLAVVQPMLQALEIPCDQPASLPALEAAKKYLDRGAETGFDPRVVPLEFGPDSDVGGEEGEEREEGEEEEGPIEVVVTRDPLEMVAQVVRSAELGQAHLAARRDYLSVLGAQAISALEPGSALADFAQLLEALEPEGAELTSGHRLPQARFMALVNERLTRPLALPHKRPQSRSYPNVCGLYLLLRASGMGLVRGGGSRLVLDPALLESWQQLSATEQYFALLEGWLLRNNPALLDQAPGPMFMPLAQWLQFFVEVPEEGLLVAKDRYWEDQIAFTPGLVNLALMEGFGLVRAEGRDCLPGKGWRPRQVSRTPFGDALLARLCDFLATQDLPPGPDPRAGGRLQPIFQPCFPQWQQLLPMPETTFTAGEHVFGVYLEGAWRLIAAPAALTLDHLARAIVQSFSFDFDHLYCFLFEDRYGLPQQVNPPFMEEPPFANHLRTGDLPLQPGDSMTLLYDFGDEWEFAMVLERIDPPNAKRKKAAVLDRRGRPPAQYGEGF
jgi:hypothetical protein